MSNLKAGTVAYLKITGEPAFVLAIAEPSVLVRRPRESAKGVKHSIELFTIAELETLEEGQTRKVSEMEELKARFGVKGSGDVPLSASDVVLPN